MAGISANFDILNESLIMEAPPQDLDDLIHLAEKLAIENDDWNQLAFSACSLGKIHILDWLIESKKTPILVKKEDGNLLHCAVINDQYEIIEWLTSTEKRRVLFCQQSGHGESPLELAIRCNKQISVEILTAIDFSASWLLSDVMGVVNRSLAIANEDVVRILKRVIQSAQLDSLRSSIITDNFDKIKQKVAQFEWFNEIGNSSQWNDADKFNIYLMLNSTAERGDTQKVKWFLEEWKVSLRPPRTVAWKGLSIADNAVMGSNIYSLDDLDEDRFSEESGYGFRLSRRYFNEVVWHRWNGKIETLIDQTKDIFEKGCGSMHLENKYWNFLIQKNSDQRLDVIKVMSERFAIDGLFCVPRLDVLVMTSQLNILKWLVLNKFYDLNSYIKKQPTEETDDGETPFEFAEDDCAICYDKKRNEHTLECGHSYCIFCIQRLCDSDLFSPHFQCPLCRTSIVAPVATTECARFKRCLETRSPWLQFDENNMSIAEILLGLAAGRGSIFIMVWLISECGIDPRQTLFDEGRNIMHIAAERGETLVCQWLLFNGFADLAKTEDQQGLTAVHCAIKSKFNTADIVLQMFRYKQVLPTNWLSCALEADNEKVVKIAMNAKADETAFGIPSLIATAASLDTIITAIKESSLDDMGLRALLNGNGQDCGFTGEHLIVKVIYAAVMFERFDFLKWILLNKSNQWLYCTSKGKEETWSGCPSLKKCCMNAASAFGHKPKVDDVLVEVHRVEDLEEGVYDDYEAFTEMIENGADVVKILETVQHQKTLIDQLPIDFQERIEYMDITNLKNTKSIVKNPLKTAFEKGHIHLLKWLLTEQQSDLTEAETIFKAVGITNLNATSAKFVLEWMCEQGISIDGLVCHNDDDLEPNENLLDFFVSTHSLRLLFPFPKETQAVARTSAASILELIEYMCNHHDIKCAISHGKCQRTLFHYVERTPFFFQQKKLDDEEISSNILRVLKLLVSAGIGLTSVNDKNSTILECMVASGEPVFLESIRWLALDMSLDIQFLDFGSESFYENLADAKAEFEKIQNEQRASRGKGNANS